MTQVVRSRSKAILPKTKETIRQLWDETVKDWEEKGIALPKEPNLGPVEQNYTAYVKYITGHDPCPICNGAMKRHETSPANYETAGGNKPLYSLQLTDVKCVRYPVHGILAKNLRLAEIVLSQMCEHELALVECQECLEKVKQERIEQCQ